eukprot:1066966-Amphidinium_carterae.1
MVVGMKRTGPPCVLSCAQVTASERVVLTMAAPSCVNHRLHAIRKVALGNQTSLNTCSLSSGLACVWWVTGAPAQ